MIAQGVMNQGGSRVRPFCVPQISHFSILDTNLVHELGQIIDLALSWLSLLLFFSTYNAFLFCDADIRDYGLVYRLFHDNRFFYCRIATFRQRTAGVCC